MGWDFDFGEEIEMLSRATKTLALIFACCSVSFAFADIGQGCYREFGSDACATNSDFQCGLPEPLRTGLYGRAVSGLCSSLVLTVLDLQQSVSQCQSSARETKSENKLLKELAARAVLQLARAQKQNRLLRREIAVLREQCPSVRRHETSRTIR